MATANGYNDDDRKRIVSAMQSMRDRLGGFLVRTYGDQFDGDIDTMLDAINFMKALRFEKPAALAVPAGYVPVSALIEARDHVEDWAAYSSPYFQAKHDLAGVLAEIDAQIAAAQAQQPAAALPEGWRVMWFTGTVTRDSERWEVYDPDGNGGAVDKGDVRDDMVRGLLDALAAALAAKGVE